MGPGLYGDEDALYLQNGYGYQHDYEAGTDADGAMTLDMVTEVDETEFDEDVGTSACGRLPGVDFLWFLSFRWHSKT